MKLVSKRILSDEGGRPVAVQIDYSEWLQIEPIVENAEPADNSAALMACAGSVDWGEDGLEYQRRLPGGVGLTHILDTNAGIYVTDNRLAAPLTLGIFGASVVTEIELLSKPGMSAQEIASVRAFLRKLNLIELTPPIREEARSSEAR